MQEDSPGPLLSANLYGSPDQAIVRVILPFWREASQIGGGKGVYFWLMRYTCGGEHLKIRIHGSENIRDALLIQFEEILRRTFLDPVTRLDVNHRSPPIDPEDLADRDCSSPLLWTRYQRSSLIFGGQPFLDDNIYASLFTLCLGMAWKAALPLLFEPKNGEAVSFSRRILMLIELIASGVHAAIPSPQMRSEYLSYHQNWMIRFPALRSGHGKEHAQRLLAVFHRKILQVRLISDKIVELIATPREAQLGSSVSPYTEWQKAISLLVRYVADQERFRVADPFTTQPIFPVMFRLFHTLANGLGVTPINEGLAYHLLIASLPEAFSRQPFLLLPPSLAEKVSKLERDSKEEVASFNFERDYLWTAYIAASGSEGRRWVDLYRPIGRKVGLEIDTALALLRQMRLNEGRAVLENVDAIRCILLRDFPSIGHVISRFYFGALSYYFYASGDFLNSDYALEKAREAVQCALQLNEWLLPLAAILTDIPLKRAVIARRTFKWQEMQRHLEMLLEMGLNRQPLCVFSSGNFIDFRNFNNYLKNVELSADKKLGLVIISDDQLRIAVIRRSIERLYALPGLLIPYP